MMDLSCVSFLCPIAAEHRNDMKSDLVLLLLPLSEQRGVFCAGGVHDEVVQLRIAMLFYACCILDVVRFLFDGTLHPS